MCPVFFFFKHHSKVWIWGIDGTTVLKEAQQRSALVGRRRAGAQRFHRSEAPADHVPHLQQHPAYKEAGAAESVTAGKFARRML